VWCSLELLQSLIDDAVDQWPQAWVLVFVPEMDTLNILCDYQLFYLYLMNFIFQTMFDAAGEVPRVHYKSMKCDVSFSRGCISTIFR